MKRAALIIMFVALAYATIWWMGERFDASPTMRDNLPSDARESTERNQP